MALPPLDAAERSEPALYDPLWLRGDPRTAVAIDARSASIQFGRQTSVSM
jgi:hypothetical protein